MGNCTSSGGGGSSAAAKSGATKALDVEESAIKSAQADVEGLAELNGTDKQKAWAKDIRNNAFGYLNNIAENTMVWGRDPKTGAKYYNDLTDERRATLDAVNLTRTALKSILGSETDAKRIIDNRSYLGYDEIKKAVNGLGNNLLKARQAGKESIITGNQKAIEDYIKRQLGYQNIGMR